MRKLSWFWFLVLIFQACTNTLPPGVSTISGKISGAGGQHIYLEELTVSDLLRVDSVEIENDGSFAFSYSPNEAGIFLLKLENEQFVTVILDKGDRLEIIADTSTFQGNYKISGNEGSEILEKYFTETSINQAQLDSLSQVFRSGTQLKNFYQIKLSVDSAFANLLYRQQHIATQLIEDNAYSLASLLLINQRFGSKKLFIEEDDLYLMMLLDSCLMRAYPDNSHVLAHHQRIRKILIKQKQQQESEAKLAPGQPAPNLSLPDPSGKQISLQSLKGKFVLISFWASYSPPCRAANIQLKEIYQQYKPKGLEVYAVSFDQNKKIWKDVIKMENLNWINVSGISGITSHIKKLYNIHDELPFFYLINREGKIIMKSKSVVEIEGRLKNLGS